MQSSVQQHKINYLEMVCYILPAKSEICPRCDLKRTKNNNKKKKKEKKKNNNNNK